jgi:YD repeat-containing protein
MSTTRARAAVISISAFRISSNGGPEVTFQRDPEGRITKITDPAGGFLTYQYNAAGDLIAVTVFARKTRWLPDPLSFHTIYSAAECVAARATASMAIADSAAP